MQRPRSSDHLSPPLAPPAVLCPNCGARMLLVSIEPHLNYKNLDHRQYICECGETTNNLVARDD
jgi:hypothetical protein